MSFVPQAVALDIDGTVLSRVGVLPSSVQASVGRVVEAGVPVVLATGRSWRATRPVAVELGLPGGYAVSANGATVMRYDPGRPDLDEIVHASTFDPAPVVSAVLARRPDVLLAVDQVDGYFVNREFPDGDLSGEIVTRPVTEMIAAPVTRLIIRDAEGSEQEFEELAASLGFHGVEYYVGYTAWLDIAAAGVSKAAGLARVAEWIDVDASGFLALGDGRNDIEMLRWAGRGVALGDAPAETMAAADDVTARFSEHGTELELDSWFA